jgi:hypothetical protein
MPSLAKRISLRFGISAPRMTVRTQTAWYWPWLGAIVIAVASYGIGSWAYDAGTRFAGFDRSEHEDELERLRNAVARLESEAARLRAVSNAGDSKLKLEQSAQLQLASQVKLLVEENTRLKEDLAFFENLAPAGERVTINRFTVQPEALPGEYRYRMLVALGGGRKERQFQGSIQLVVNVQTQGRSAMIVIPEDGRSESAAFKLNFKYFQRVEGTFRVPEKVKLQSVQVRVLEQGNSQARAVQMAELS